MGYKATVFFTKYPSTSHLVTMFDVTSLIDSNNRIRLPALQNFVQKHSAYNFVTAIPYPFLVGKSLITGDLFNQSYEYYDATLRFQPNDLGNPQGNGPTAITRAIYLIIKNPLFEDPPLEEELDSNAIFVGRSSKNDITINDYAISKTHAFIRYKSPHYYIEDAGSTNGIVVNNVKLHRGEQCKLTPKSTIEFGRFTFMFIHPLELYYRTLSMIKDEPPTKDDLMQIARVYDLSILRSIASTKGALLDIKPKKMDILNYMSSNLTENQIIDWLYEIPLRHDVN